MPNTGTAVALAATVEEAVIDEVKISPFERRKTPALIEIYDISFGLGEPLADPDNSPGSTWGHFS